MPQWVVYIGEDAVFLGALPTFESAMRFVSDDIVRPKGDHNFEWRLQMSANGCFIGLFWAAPLRPMTEDEVRLAHADGRCSMITMAHWLKNPPLVPDYEAIEKAVEFPSGRVPSVMIKIRADDLEYTLVRASPGNFLKEKSL